MFAVSEDQRAAHPAQSIGGVLAYDYAGKSAAGAGAYGISGADTWSGELNGRTAGRSDVAQNVDFNGNSVSLGMLAGNNFGVTSSDGSSVLPFKSSLLEPATQSKYPLTFGRVHYTLENGADDPTVAYWGDDVFFPHLLNLLSKRRVCANVRFAPVLEHSLDRKELAQQLHAAVLGLKN